MIDKESQIQEATQEQQTPVDTASEYIEAIKNIKANSVDRQKYDEVVAANKQLLNSLVNGQPAEIVEDKVHPDLNKLREQTFHKEGISNLEFWENALLLRSELIESGERDPFLPYGQNIAPTYEDTQAAERVADVVQQCIDYAQGDSQVFTNELQRRTVDIRHR